MEGFYIRLIERQSPRQRTESPRQKCGCKISGGEQGFVYANTRVNKANRERVQPSR